MAGQPNGKQLIQILCVLCVLALSAFTCDNGSKEKLGVPGKNPPPQPGQVATVGADVCTVCHAVDTDHWLQGAHANLEAIDHTTHAPLSLGLNSDGFPYYDMFTDASCAVCHDPLSDGRDLVPDLTGNVDRPVIGCESCHGGGAEHFGTGDIPFPKPDAERCGQCHNSSFPTDHLTYHPNGAGIYEEYIESPHAESMNSHIFDAASGDVRAICSRCHTDEGFRKYEPLISGRTGHDALEAWFVGAPNLDATETSAIECRTCHDAHTTSKNQLESINSETVATVALSPQFNTCTQCHQLAGNDGKVLAGSTDGAYHDPVANSHGSLEEIITDTHAAVPGDTRGNYGAGALALFYVTKTDKSACAKCHNPHSADLTPNREWIRSGHGDVLSTVWNHTSSSCVRCHTASGSMNYLTALKNHTSVPATDLSMYASNQKQALYCWGCHSDYKGGLINPGAFTAPWNNMDQTPHVFPDVSGSNVCVTCHSNRASSGNVTVISNFASASLPSNHHGIAAAVLFKAGGYEFSGKVYTNPSYFEHDILGLGLLGSTVDAVAGVNGPCAACHMTSNPEKHLFSPIAVTGDTVTGITSTLCSLCHSGTHELTAADLQEQSELFAQSKQALSYYVTLRGMSGTNWIHAAPFTNGQMNMGAAWNNGFVAQDPGAYAHNRVYTKRLIYDSIDYLDDGVLNDTVKASLEALDPLVQTWRDGAIAYLSPNGSRP